MPELISDAEFHGALESLINNAKSGYKDHSALSHDAHVLCDNAYRRIVYANDVGPAGVKVGIPNTGVIPTITQTSLKSRLYKNAMSILGVSCILNPPPPPISQKEFYGKYFPKGRVLSKAEQAAVPILPSYCEIPPEAQQICEMIRATADSTTPIQNLMLRGPAGTGKTSLAKAIAAGLGLPYVFQTCSPDYEIFDFIGQEYPNEQEVVQLPTLNDVKMAPASAYFNLCGIARLSASWEDVYSAVYEQLHGSMSGNGQFRYITSPFLDAMQHGWVCEIQEADIISKPAVLTGLNSMLDDCRMITLPNKTTVKRHKDAILILTGNTTYNGCRELNQATLSRMSLIYDFDALTAEEMAERAFKATGFPDKAVVTKMAKIVVDIADKCADTEIRDGVCGYRELLNWVLAYIQTGDMLESAKFTVLSHATASWEDRKVIEDEVLKPQLAA